MELIPAELLAALAAGHQSATDRRAWAELSMLVSRPLQWSSGSHRPSTSTGEAEMAALRREPTDPTAAQRLSMAIALRAMVDPDFYSEVSALRDRLALGRTTSGDVINTIDRGTVHGSAVMAREIEHVTINSPAPPPEPSAAERHQAETFRRSAVRDAAYSRLLSRLPQPRFEAVRWVITKRSFWNLQPEQTAYSAPVVDKVLSDIKMFMDGKRRPEDTYGHAGPEERCNKVAAYLSALQLNHPEKGDHYRPPLYSATSVDLYVAKYRQCLSDYFRERDQA